jgi:quinol monooxygenase YgiN
MDVKPLVLVAIFRARPGCEAELGLLLATLVAPTHQEDGCLRYELNHSVSDPAQYFFTEIWLTGDHHARHLETPHLRAFLATVPELLADPIRELKGATVAGSDDA